VSVKPQIPKSATKLCVPITPEDVVHQHIEPPVVGVNPLHEPSDLIEFKVVDTKCDALTAGRGDELTGLLDGLRTINL
jgi:hypothetical protein